MRNNKSGFTLIELLVVVLIIGILASIALPNYQVAVDKARFVEIRSAVDALARAEEIYYLANGDYTMDIKDLDIAYALPPNTSGGSGSYKFRSGSYVTITNINASRWASNSEEEGGGHWTPGKEGYINAMFREGTSIEKSVSYFKFLEHMGGHPGEGYCVVENAYERGNRVCKALGGKLETGAGRPSYRESLNFYRLN